MPPEHRPVYLDTCAILAAVRAGCFNDLASRFKLHTVAECRAELTRGDKTDPLYIHVDMANFDRKVSCHDTSDMQRVNASVRTPDMAAIDAGERDLLAWCADQPDAFILATGDRAAALAACRLGLADRLVSLEELAEKAGKKSLRLRNQHTRRWLEGVRLEYLTGEGIL